MKKHTPTRMETIMASSIWDPPRFPKLEAIPTDLESLIDHANEVYAWYRARFLGFNTPLDTQQVGQCSIRIRDVLEIIRQEHGRVLVHLPLNLPDDLRAEYADLLVEDHAAMYNEDMSDFIQ